MNFTISSDLRGKMKENEKNRQILGSCPRAEKSVEPESHGDTNR